MHRWIAFAVVSVGLSSAPVLAHHGTGISYDNSTLITSKATVTAFDFTNPHVRIFFDTTDEKSHIKHWSGEMANPAQYIRAGWGKKRSSDALKPGTPITISYWLSKAEENLPADIGAALVVRIRSANDERILLDRR